MVCKGPFLLKWGPFEFESIFSRNYGAKWTLGGPPWPPHGEVEKLAFLPFFGGQFGTKTGPFLLKVWAICFWKYIQLRLWGQILPRGNRFGVRPVFSHSSVYWHCHRGYFYKMFGNLKINCLYYIFIKSILGITFLHIS